MEEWRDIPGYEGIYKVSSLGIIQGIKKGSGGKRAPHKKKMMPNGYERACLYNEGKYKHLGMFKTLQEAKNVVDKFNSKQYGEFYIP